jgi:hypothetical protein
LFLFFFFFFFCLGADAPIRKQPAPRFTFTNTSASVPVQQTTKRKTQDIASGETKKVEAKKKRKIARMPIANGGKVLTKDSGYHCDICDKDMHYASAQKHKQMHLGLKPYECFVCDMKFVSEFNRKRHKSNKHSADESTLEKFLSEVKKTKKTLAAQVVVPVKDPFPVVRAKPVADTQEHPFACSTCSKTLKTPKALYNHMMTHNKKHVCQHCNHKFRDRSELARHVTRGRCKTAQQAFDSQANAQAAL